MNSAKGQVRTLHADKYIRQLCKHWAHKLEVQEGDGTGIIKFASGVATFEASSEVLTVKISSEVAETVEQLKDVISRHLDRFAFREAPLQFEWA